MQKQQINLRAQLKALGIAALLTQESNDLATSDTSAAR
jgi:hypothetical protein